MDAALILLSVCGCVRLTRARRRLQHTATGCHRESPLLQLHIDVLAMFAVATAAVVCFAALNISLISLCRPGCALTNTACVVLPQAVPPLPLSTLVSPSHPSHSSPPYCLLPSATAATLPTLLQRRRRTWQRRRSACVLQWRCL